MIFWPSANGGGEQICCAFLDFNLVERPDAIVVTVTAPEGCREARGDPIRAETLTPAVLKLTLGLSPHGPDY